MSTATGDRARRDLRFAVLADVPDILSFWQRSAEDAHRPVDVPAAVESLIARDPQALELAIADGRIVGSLVSGFDGWRCHLYRLAVDPQHRGNGIARELLQRAEQRFRALGATRADAMVLDDNDLGGGFWAANGYAPQPEWSRWVKPL